MSNDREKLQYLKDLCKEGPYKYDNGFIALNLHLDILWLYYLKSGNEYTNVDLCMSEQGISETVKVLYDMVQNDKTESRDNTTI